jgi:hypothetical protein
MRWYVIARQTFTRPEHEVNFGFHGTVVQMPAKVFEGGRRAFQFSTKRDATYFVAANPAEPWLIEKGSCRNR